MRSIVYTCDRCGAKFSDEVRADNLKQYPLTRFVMNTANPIDLCSMCSQSFQTFWGQHDK